MEKARPAQGWKLRDRQIPIAASRPAGQSSCARAWIYSTEHHNARKGNVEDMAFLQTIYLVNDWSKHLIEIKSSYEKY
jgi:hypothetical protein